MRLYKKIAYILCASAGLNILAIYFYFSAPARATTLYFFDVGQGDSMLIQDTQGRQVIIDGGPNNNLSRYLAKYMPYGDTTIDALILTHPHYDHYFGLIEVLKKYQVGEVILPLMGSSAKTWQEFLKQIQLHHTTAYMPQEGAVLSMGDAELQVVSPGVVAKDLNDSSIILRFSYGDYDALLMGDAGQVIEAPLVAHPPRAITDHSIELLKVGHHGSSYASTAQFIRFIHPHDAVISVGARNTYGHPGPDTISRLQQAGARVWRTDKNGTIMLQCSNNNCELHADHSID